MSFDIFLWRTFIALLILGAFFVVRRIVFGDFNIQKVDLLRAKKVFFVVVAVIVIAFVTILLSLFLFGSEFK